MKRFLATFALLAVAGAATAGEIKDPHYGDTLFHFYQERYFTAVTTLMVSQHFERVPQHADEAEVLRGGMLLSYGLHREAGEIFAQLIDKGAAPAVRDRAWFYLAKIRYQRGLLADAQAALARIENALPSELDEERVLLQANVLMARNDHAAAAKLLAGAAGRSGASAYARYNLGVALIKSGDSSQGSALLDAVGQAPAANEEARSLRDKANVALGFTALQEQRPEQARTYLERVRLNSPQATKALLGFGWAADSLKQPAKALVPWTELTQRELSDAAVLEGQIAVPYAYAELGAFGQSLQRYQAAIALFEHESTALDESIAAVRSGKLVDALIERNPGEEMGWFWNIGTLPALPHAGHLAPLLAQHEFQEAFKNYRDLLFLAKNLQGWADKLGVFDDMLANRRQAYAQRLPQVRAQRGELSIDALQKRRDALAAELAQAEDVADGRAFADDKQRELLARIARVREALAANPDENARERLRLIEGALGWQLAQAYSARMWDARKAMKITDEGLAQARQRDTALAQAQRDEPARFERFAARIPGLGQRIQTLLPRVAALTGEQRAQLEDLAVAELTRQKERLQEYGTQARFAVAQLVDRATLTKSDDHAPR